MADPKIRYDIAAHTEGGGEVDRLAASLEQLDQAIDPAAAARAQELSSELQRLGGQQAAVSRFQELGAAVDKARGDLAGAEAAVAAMRAEIDASGTPTTAQAGRLEKLGAAATAAAGDFRAQAAALTASQGRLAALGIDANEAAAAEQRLGAATTAVRAELQALGASLQGVRARELVEELRQLGQQQQAIESFRNLDAALGKAQAGLTAAEGALDAYRSKLASVEAPTAAQVATQQRLAFAVDDARAKVVAQSAALDAARGGLQRLGIETIDLAAAEERLRTASQGTLAQVRELATGLQTTGRQAKEAADAAAAAAEKIDSAFRTLGVRSVQQIEAEIVQVRAAMATAAEQARSTGAAMASAFAAGEAKISALQRELRELNGTLTTADRLSSAFKGSLSQIAVGNVIADGVGYLVNKVKELASAFVETIVQADQLRRGLTAVYGSVATTASQMLFLRETALSSGVSVGSLSQNFVKFAASMTAANVPIAQSNALFSALTRAAGTLGLSGEQVTGMLEALSQMASKGAVSMEELRQQLGDRLPGALSLVAKGFGITEAELIKLVESGNLAARDLFPALTSSLQSMKGDVEGLAPGFENLKTALTASAQAAGESGWTQLLVLGLRALGAVLGVVVVTIQGFSEGLFLAGKAALAFYGALRGDPGALTFLSDELEKTRDRLALTTKLFYDLATGAQASAPAVQQSAAAQAAHAAAMDKTIDAASRLSVSTGQTAQGTAALKLANDIAAKSAGDLSSGYVQLSSKLASVVDELNKQQDAADKEAKAVKINGDAIAALTQLRGGERDALQASATAAENNTTALQKAAGLRQAEVEVLTVQRDALIQLAMAQDGSLEKRKADIDAISKKLIVAAAEAEQAKASALAAQNEATARQVAAKAYDDNSASLEKFRAAATAAKEAVIAADAAEREGLGTKEQVMAARRAEAEAMALYNDALKDTAANLKAQASVEQAAIGVKQAGLSVTQAAYQQSAAAARASGDLAQATYYEVEAKRTQIKITELTMQAKRLEVEATIKAVEAERQQLIATNNLTPAKKLELDARLLNAKAKAIEAGAGADVVAALQREIDAIYAAANARGAGISTIQQDTSVRNANTDAINRQTGALRQQQQPDPYGRTPDQVARLKGQGPIDSTYSFAVRDRLNSGGKFSAEDIQGLEAGLRAAKDNAKLGTKSWIPDLAAQRDDAMWVTIFTRALEKARGSAIQVKTPAATPAPATRSTGGPPAIPPMPTAYSPTGWVLENGTTWKPGPGAPPAEPVSSPSSAAQPSKTVRLDLSLNGGKRLELFGTEPNVDALLRGLEQAQRMAGA